LSPKEKKREIKGRGKAFENTKRKKKTYQKITKKYTIKTKIEEIN
jgi:hypothetical protein